MTTHVTSANPQWVWATASNNYITPSGSNPVGDPVHGDLQYNTVTQQLQAFDGNSWREIYTTVSVGLTNQTTEVLDWARKKMEEETRFREACVTSPAVADAYAAYQEAADKLKVILSLTQENS
jgi:hypothetical protein